MFRQDIRYARAVFFIGYYLSDLDIKRILFDSKELKEKAVFGVGDKVDSSTERRASRFGNVFKITADDLVKRIAEVRKTHIAKDASHSSVVTLKEYEQSSGSASVPDRAFLDLLLFGNRRDSYIAESLRSGRTYFLERSVTPKLFNSIQAGNSVIVVTSDLGNGKSLLLDGLRLRALEHGYRVF